MDPDSIPRQAVSSALRLDLAYFGVSLVIALSGVCSLLLTRLRSRDRLLLWLGVLSILYAIRLFLQNVLVLRAYNASEADFAPVTLSITYTINIPFALFALELLGRGTKASIAIWAGLCTGFGIVAIPISLVAHRTHWLDLVNWALVVGGTLGLLLNILMNRRTCSRLARSLVWPLAFFGVCILLHNEGFRIDDLSIEPVGFLVLLIGLGSIAIKRALTTQRRLIDVEQELSTARRIQLSILPECAPHLEGVKVAMRYQPMTSVAGDFYDFQLSDHLLTILVADVSGHGVPAALIACMLKVCFAAQKVNASNPAAILSGLGLMIRDSLGGQYVTAACAAIDTDSHTITYAGAGHPPSVIVRRKQGDTVLLDQNGLFLGPFPNATYENLCLPFRSGDRLLVYTDGITEAHDFDGEEFGRERLRDLLLQSREIGPESVLDRLFRQISTHDPQDDLTAVLVHFE